MCALGGQAAPARGCPQPCSPGPPGAQLLGGGEGGLNLPGRRRKAVGGAPAAPPGRAAASFVTGSEDAGMRPARTSGDLGGGAAGGAPDGEGGRLGWRGADGKRAGPRRAQHTHTLPYPSLGTSRCPLPKFPPRVPICPLGARALLCPRLVPPRSHLLLPH